MTLNNRHLLPTVLESEKSKIGVTTYSLDVLLFLFGTRNAKKKCKKAKWLSQEVLQIAVKRREVKSKGEKKRYKHLNAEFQRIARRDKKAFLSDQCKEIEVLNKCFLINDRAA